MNDVSESYIRRALTRALAYPELRKRIPAEKAAASELDASETLASRARRKLSFYVIAPAVSGTAPLTYQWQKNSAIPKIKKFESLMRIAMKSCREIPWAA